METKFRLYNKQKGQMLTWEDINQDWYYLIRKLEQKEGTICYNEATEESYIHFENTEDNSKELVIMTSTGMKDKNGKDIYYGDIIKLPNFIQYDKLIEGEFTYEPVSYKRACTFVGEYPVFQDYFWIQENGEVVGNMYENKDLLELNITHVVEK